MFLSIFVIKIQSSFKTIDIHAFLTGSSPNNLVFHHQYIEYQFIADIFPVHYLAILGSYQHY